jgi:aspartate-semialdehyde dehydrogenase
MKTYNVGIVGATGTVGSIYVKLLENHPWFNVTRLFASASSAGQTYEMAMQNKWRQATPVPVSMAKIVLEAIDKDFRKDNLDIVFSASDSDSAEFIEAKLASVGIGVFSNSAFYRTNKSVPIIIPEINSYHLRSIRYQNFDQNRLVSQPNKPNKSVNVSYKPINTPGLGFIVTNPNCTLQAAALPLFPLNKLGVLNSIIITSMQAVSGAGYPGLPSLDILNNIIPYIAQGEEAKMEFEIDKIFGMYVDDASCGFEKSLLEISASCNRVPVINGHTVSVNFSTTRSLSREDIVSLWDNFWGLDYLPSAQKPVVYLDQPDRPQPRFDEMTGEGMTVTVGNLRQCNVLDWKFTALVNNTIRGASGGSVLNAEYWAYHIDQ